MVYHIFIHFKMLSGDINMSEGMGGLGWYISIGDTKHRYGSIVVIV